MVFHPGVFGYGGFVCEAIDACVLMLLQKCIKSTPSLANVQLSARAQYFVDDIWLLLCREEVFDPSEEQTEGVSDLNTAWMLKSLHTLQILSLMPARN